MRVRRIFKLWCKHCRLRTVHRYLPDAPTDGTGLVYRCLRCDNSAVHSRTAALSGGDVD